MPNFLNAMLTDPYFSKPIPKSTGRDYFHLQWVEKYLSMESNVRAVDVQASLVELTAISIARQLQLHMPDCSNLIICGGGVANTYLFDRIRSHCLNLIPGINVCSSKEQGIDPQAVEGLAFAWLAWCFMQSIPGNIPSVTGARAPRILGALYPR